MEEEAYWRASATSSFGRRRSGSSFGTAAVGESQAPGRMGSLPDGLSRRGSSYGTAAVAPEAGFGRMGSLPDGLSRRSGSFGTAAVAPMPAANFGASLWQPPAALSPEIAPVGVSAWQDPATPQTDTLQLGLGRQLPLQPPPPPQLAVLSAPLPAQLPIELQQLSAPLSPAEHEAPPDLRRASFVTAVPERPSAARRRQHAESYPDMLASDLQQQRQRSLDRPPLSGGGFVSSEQQGRQAPVQQERQQSLEAARQQMLRRHSGERATRLQQQQQPERMPSLERQRRRQLLQHERRRSLERLLENEQERRASLERQLAELQAAAPPSSQAQRVRLSIAMQCCCGRSCITTSCGLTVCHSARQSDMLSAGA